MDPNIRPLTPDVLKRMRAVQPGLPRATFEADGGWRRSYRVWQSVGKRREDNAQSRTIGSLTLSRSPVADDGFALRVRQQVLMIENPTIRYGGVHEINAEIDCANDALATPRRWRVEHRFHRHQKLLENLPLVYEGRADDGRVRQTINGRERVEPITGPWTAGWCLFAALPRMLEAGDMEHRFTQFDRFRTPRPDQHLFPRHEADFTSEFYGPMRCVAQIGSGGLPIDYWLDDSGQMPFVTNLHMAFIADDEAEEKIDRILRDNILMQFEAQEVA